MEQELRFPAEKSANWYFRLVFALGSAIVASALAFAIFFLVIGLRTDMDADYNPILVPQYKSVYILMALAFVGQFVRHLLSSRKARESQKSDEENVRQGAWETLKLERVSAFVGGRLGILLLMFSIIFPFLPFTDRYLLDLAILILTYVMLGWGLNIVVGLAGLLDLGYVAFYAVGAYTYALFSTAVLPWLVEEGYFSIQILDWAFWLCLPLGGILAALWGIALGFPVLRLRGDYLAIVTLAFGEIIRLVLLNWYNVTGGPDGISQVPRPSFFGIDFGNDVNDFAALFGLEYANMHRVIFLYYLILLLALFTNFVTNRLRKLPVGRAWEALREDETACRSLGINVTMTKLTAFAIGAMFGGVAGTFFATRQGFVNPESFVFMESALVLAIVVLGGLGSQIGIAIAAIVMIGGIEAARELYILKSIPFFGPNFDPSLYRMLIFGIAMVVVMIWRPRGFVRHRTPSIFLSNGRLISNDFVAEGRG